MEDGVASVTDLAQRARSLGMRALALTDHNTLAGAVPFSRACAEAGVRPIIGAELDVAAFDAKVATYSHYRLVVLCQTELGYRNLVWLVARAHANINAKQSQPLLRFDDLKNHAAGLLALTGGMNTELYQLLEAGRFEETEAHVTELARVFERSNVVFELQDFAQPRQKEINRRIYDLAEFLTMRIVATNDVHYLRPEDGVCFDFLKGDRPPTFLDFAAARSPEGSRHLATSDEMRRRFHTMPKACFGTNEIAELCGFQFNFHKRRFPVQDFVRGFDADSFLWDLTFREARSRYTQLSNEMKDRLNAEFETIKTEGLSNNILLLWNVAQYCRQNGIHMGVGRGNMISSLVAYILGITQINPMDYKLRFLGFDEDDSDKPGEKVRSRCLTVEISKKHTKELMEFLRQAIGPDSVSAVGKYQPTSRTTLAKDICNWFNCSTSILDKLVELPRDGNGRLPELESFFPPRRGDGVALPHVGLISFMLSRMLPRPRSLDVMSNHIALSGENLNNLVPRQEACDEIVTQFDGPALDALNIPRLLVEPHPLLNIIDSATVWVHKEDNANFDPDKISLDDSSTYDLLSEGRTNGIGPFHSISLKSLLRMHRPRNFMGLMKLKSMDRTATADHEPDVRDHVPDCLLTYRCAFIKAHFARSFMAALLTHSHDEDWKRFTLVLREAKQMNLQILPPDINRSQYEFSHEHKAIRTGLKVIHGLGLKTYAEIERVRKSGDFNDMVELVRRTDGRLVNSLVLGNLVKAGALDCFGFNRAQMLEMISEGLKVGREDGSQMTLFDLSADKDFLKDIDPPNIPEMSPSDMMRNEIAATGYCISEDQLHLYSDLMRRCRALPPTGLTARMVESEVHIAGFLDHVETESFLNMEDREQVLLDLEGHVVSMPRKAANLYAKALVANAPVLVGGTVKRRKDEIYLKGVTAFTLRMVQQMSEEVLKMELNLEGEDFRTLLLIRRLVKLHRGGATEVAIINEPKGVLAGLFAQSIRKTRVFFSPPVYYALKKILSEERIALEAGENADSDLLHALSPLRFPRTSENVTAAIKIIDPASVVDVY